MGNAVRSTAIPLHHERQTWQSHMSVRYCMRASLTKKTGTARISHRIERIAPLETNIDHSSVQYGLGGCSTDGTGKRRTVDASRGTVRESATDRESLRTTDRNPAARRANPGYRANRSSRCEPWVRFSGDSIGSDAEPV